MTTVMTHRVQKLASYDITRGLKCSLSPKCAQKAEYRVFWLNRKKPLPEDRRACITHARRFCKRHGLGDLP